MIVVHENYMGNDGKTYRTEKEALRTFGITEEGIATWRMTQTETSPRSHRTISYKFMDFKPAPFGPLGATADATFISIIYITYMGKHGHLYQREREALYSLGITENGNAIWHTYTVANTPVSYCVLRFFTPW